MSELNIYIGMLLLFMAIVMMGVAVRTCVQVFRLRNKRLSWRAGTLKGFPLFSTIFLAVSSIFGATLGMSGEAENMTVASLYIIIAGAWFISSYFASKRYITDYGIVKNVNDPAQTIAWYQIHDFFEQKVNGTPQYTFIYRRNNQDPLEKVIRLELQVPDHIEANFKKLISHKLGRRISCYEESIDVAQF